MKTPRQHLFDRLNTLGIQTQTIDHAAVHTVEDNQRLRGDMPGGHFKNLFLKDKKGQRWLVVALEDKPVDMKDLKKRIGSAHLSFGKPELLFETLGVTPGSVTPLALFNDTDACINVVLDEEIKSFNVLNFHPLENTATTSIAPDDLIRFINDCGHNVTFVAL